MQVDTKPETAAKLLARLVACPSMNPGPLALPAPGYGEEAMAKLLESLLRPWGAQTSIEELAPGRCNFLATWPGKRRDRALLLEAHADTVGSHGMTIPPFEPAIGRGRLYGRGACDTKGPMAAMLLAIRQILDEYGQPPVTLHFAATGDEENSGTGASRLVESGLNIDAAIVAEPSEMRIAYAHKGACRFRITVLGKAAHSSVPALGINAIEAAAELVTGIQHQFLAHLAHQAHPELVMDLQPQFGTRLPHQTHPGLGPTTCCVSTISGGERVNSVPDRCRIEVDCRCLPGERHEHLEQAMRQTLNKALESRPDVQYQVEIFQWYPALAGSRTDPFVSSMAAASREWLGPDSLGTVPYATNAGFFSEAGIPCIVFGPGSIAQAHTADEFIELSQLDRAVPVYANMIRRFV